jgi:quinol monooxygenase YgiN
VSDSVPEAAPSSLMIVGRFEVAPEDRDAFVAGQRPGVEAARAEPGCLRYLVSPDLLEPGVVNLFEHWADDDALASHLAALKVRPAPSTPKVEVLKASVKQYRAGPPGRVGS